jgi:multidrug resistance efflux pump
MANTRIEKIEQKIAALEAQRAKALSRQKNMDRRRRVRQAILIGQYVVDRCRNPGDDGEKLERFVRKIAESLPREKDKELVLELVPAKSEAKATRKDAA